MDWFRKCDPADKIFCPYCKHLKSLFKCIASGDSGSIFLTEISSTSLFLGDAINGLGLQTLN